MTYEEKLLTRYLLISGMNWGKAAYIVGTLQAQQINEMLEYIAKTQEMDPNKLYSIGCEIAEKYKSETEQRGDSV